MDEKQLRRQADSADSARQRILDRVKASGRHVLTDDEDREFRRLTDLIDSCDGRITQAADEQRRVQMRSLADRIFCDSHSSSSRSSSRKQTMRQHTAESRVYNATTAAHGRSFWRDLVAFKTGDDATGEARARLNEHADEQRTGLTTTGDGASFAPPVYLESLWIEAAVAAKPFVACVPEYEAPRAPTINVPKITAPGAVGVQTELAPVTNVDQTDQFLSTPLTTIAGNQTVSRQLLDQSPIDIDSVIFSGLSQSWAQQQDQTALYGTGANGEYTGIANLPGITQVAWAGNTIQEIYTGLTTAIKLHWQNRFLAPTTVLVHPNTAAEWLAKLDTTDRPLFVPSAQGPFNAAGIVDSLNAQGPIGKILGLDLVLDPNIGSANGVESVFVFRADDIMFFTSGMKAQVFQDRFADQLAILLSLWSYDGLIARYPNAIIELTGFPYGS